MKLIVATFVAAAVLASGMATETQKRTHNEVDNTELFEKEKGIHFYEDRISPTDSEGTPVPKKPGDVISLLEAILNENKEQTKTQKAILAILQDSLDPQPKTMTLPDGTECIENSSAECYKMPKIPEARNIPALSQWMDDPTNIQKAANYTRWQARHIQQAKDMGHAMQFAVEQFGKEAYPINFRRTSFDSATGYWGVLEKKHRLSLINQNADKMEFLVFIGNNIDMDLYAADALSEFLNAADKVKTTFIFKDQLNQNVYKDTGKILLSLGKALDRSTSKVNAPLFDQYRIQMTPSLVVLYKDKEGNRHAQTVSVGRRGKDTLAGRIVSFMEFKRIIDTANTVDYEVWQEQGDKATEHFRNFYGYDLNQTVIDTVRKTQEGGK